VGRVTVRAGERCYIGAEHQSEEGSLLGGAVRWYFLGL